MALWLVRAGQHGEYEQRFLDTNRIYATWERLRHDLSKLDTQEGLREVLKELYPESSKGKIINHSSQLWPFAHEMAVGDWVALPSKFKPAIHFGEIKGPYVYDASAEDPYYHSRKIKWFAEAVPRSNFDQDLLYSFGAFMTICRIKRNDAERRIQEMAENGWKPSVINPPPIGVSTPIGEVDLVELEQLARDQIAKVIIRKFKGHGLTRLVEAVLKAQGYTTYRSPEGPDKGIDILAAPGPLGFSQPRICVQVKSGDTPVDLATLNQLIGSMQNVQADQGLFVSWAGFKSSVDKEVPPQFFRVRLWDQYALIEELLTNYEKLDEDLKAELPLKRIWTIAVQEETE